MTRKPSPAASKKRESEQRKERELFSWHSPFPLGGESERAIFAFVTLVCCKHARDRETERQRDRETERQRDGGIKRRWRLSVSLSLRPSVSPSLILPVPRDGAPQTFGQSDQREVADQVFGARDGCERMSDVAGARLLVAGGKIRADDLLQFGEQLIKRDPLAYPQVDDLSDRFSGFSRAQIRVDHVRDVCEIARLLAVAINHRRFARKQGSDEFRDHAGIRR